VASILVIEDVPAVLLSLRMVLESSGHRVTGAADPAEGLSLLGDGRFDVVVTDIWMPGGSGTDVIREGRRRRAATKFLAITGGDPNGRTSPEQLRGEDFGADAVLFKPFEKQELLDAVARLLDPARTT
jgi:CheY-like chemotaxis protein